MSEMLRRQKKESIFNSLLTLFGISQNQFGIELIERKIFLNSIPEFLHLKDGFIIYQNILMTIFQTQNDSSTDDTIPLNRLKGALKGFKIPFILSESKKNNGYYLLVVYVKIDNNIFAIELDFSTYRQLSGNLMLLREVKQNNLWRIITNEDGTIDFADLKPEQALENLSVWKVHSHSFLSEIEITNEGEVDDKDRLRKLQKMMCRTSTRTIHICNGINLN